MTPEQFEQAQSLFADAAELPPEQRAAFLDEHAAGDPVVRAEVEQLLAALGDAGRFLDKATVQGIPPPVDEVRVAWPERIGQYRILGICGHGGMGTVFVAEQERPLRRVALKVMRADVATRSLLRRFRAEAEILGRLQHPGIAQVFEAGTHDTGEGGRPFFAMEYIDGPPIDEFVRSRKLELRQRLALFARVCDAVSYAHQKGIVHRDLKPGNVLVVDDVPLSDTSTGTRTMIASGQPKVLDFGIARITDSDVQMTTMRTTIGELIGTIAYMSPEQAAGDSRELDTRSDIYALGVLLYELLVARAPYDLGQSIPEAVLAIREQEPVRLGSIDATLRGDVETIVSTCLEKEPERRYQSAAELAADIRRHLYDEPIQARAPSAFYQLAKFTRRNKVLVGGIAATMLALVAGTIVAITLAVAAGRNAAAARYQAYRAGIQAADGLIDADPIGATARLEETPPEFRNWEWRHLSSRLKRHLPVLDAGDTLVGAPMTIADGTVLAVRADGVVVAWEPIAGTRSDRLDLGASVRDFAVSPDERHLAIVTTEGIVRVHRLADGQAIVVPTFDGGAEVVAWERAGTGLVAGRANFIGVWRGEAAWTVHDFDEHETTMNPPLVVLPGDRRAIVRRGARVYLVDLEAGTTLTHHFHTEIPQCIALSPDGRHLVVGYEIRGVRLLDTENLEEIASFGGHLGTVDDVGFSSDGNAICSSGNDGSVRVWDRHRGIMSAQFQIGAPEDVAFTADDTRVLCRTGDRLQQWTTNTGSSTVLRGHDSYVYNVAWSPDGARLASTTFFTEDVRLWDARDGSAIGVVPADISRAVRLLFNPDGSQLLVANLRRRPDMAVVDLDRGETQRIGTGGVSVLTLGTARGGWLETHRGVGGGPMIEPGRIVVWRTEYTMENGALVERAFGDGQPLMEVTTKAGGDHNEPGPVPLPIFVGNLQSFKYGFAGRMAELIVYDGPLSPADTAAVEQYLERRRRGDDATPPGVTSAATAAHFIADEQSVVTSDADDVRSWSAFNDRSIVLRALSTSAGDITLDAAGMDGRPIIRFRISDRARRRLRGMLPDDVRLRDPTVFWLGSFDSDTDWYGYAYSIGLGYDADPVFWRQVLERAGDDGPGARISASEAVSPDGKTVATTYEGQPNPIALLDLRTQTLIDELEGDYLGVAWHPDGRRLAAASAGGVIDIWDVPTRTKIAELAGHYSTAYCVAYTPDGTRLASGGNEGVIRIWDPETGDQLLELRGHEQYVRAIAFSPDGTRLASASGDTTVRVWHTE